MTNEHSTSGIGRTHRTTKDWAALENAALKLRMTGIVNEVAVKHHSRDTESDR